MSSKKISELDLMSSSSLSPNDLFVVVDVDENDNTLITKKLKNEDLSSYFLNTVAQSKADRNGDNISVDTLTYSTETVPSTSSYILDFDGINIRTSIPTTNTSVNFSNPSYGKSIYFKLEPTGSIYTLSLQNDVTVMNYFSTTIRADTAVVISAICTGTGSSDINVTVSIQQ